MAKVPYSVAMTIHMGVNSNNRYTSDAEKYKESEKWVEADGEGDCEDYALAKRRLLREQGYGAYCHLATCWTEKGEYHAVLIVCTDDGDYVLDNRHVFPKMKQELGYTWDKIERLGQWFSVS